MSPLFVTDSYAYLNSQGVLHVKWCLTPAHNCQQRASTDAVILLMISALGQNAVPMQFPRVFFLLLCFEWVNIVTISFYIKNLCFFQVTHIHSNEYKQTKHSLFNYYYLGAEITKQNHCITLSVLLVLCEWTHFVLVLDVDHLSIGFWMATESPILTPAPWTMLYTVTGTHPFLSDKQNVLRQITEHSNESLILMPSLWTLMYTATRIILI